MGNVKKVKGTISNRVPLNAYKRSRSRINCSGCSASLGYNYFWKTYSEYGNLRLENNIPTTFICKSCMKEWYKTIILLKNNNNHLKAMFELCVLNNWYYDSVLLKNIIKDNKAEDLPDNYAEIICDKNNDTYLNKTFLEQIDFVKFEKYNKKEIEENYLNEEDKKNRSDIINTFKFDPFAEDAIKDKPTLYRNLSLMIDEEIINDFPKQQAALNVVRGYVQLDQYDERVGELIELSKLIDEENKNIKNNNSSEEDKTEKISLITIAEEIQVWNKLKTEQQKMINNICKENNLSARYMQTKKNSRSLTAIMKEMEQKNYDEGKVNLYDILTSESISQIAQLNIQAIQDQLRLTEYDYASMVAEQSVVIQELTLEKEKIEEELRLLKGKHVKQQLIEELRLELKNKGIPSEEIENIISLECKNDKEQK